MPMPLAVVASDNHLQHHKWVNQPSLWGDSYHSFEQTVDYCIRNELDLILPGDVLDKQRPDPHTIRFLCNQINRFAKYNRKKMIFFTQGQHELDRDTPWLNAVHMFPLWLHEQTFKLHGINLYGLDWTPADSIHAKLDAIPLKTDVLMCHQVWQEFMGDRAGKYECSFADVPHARLVLTGDFHTARQLDVTGKTGQKMRVLSPGSACMQSISEPATKYFHVLHDDLTTTHIRLKTRQMFDYYLESGDQLDKFLMEEIERIQLQDGVPDNIRMPIVRVRYSDQIANAYALLHEALRDRCHLWLDAVKRETETIQIDTEKAKAVAEGGLKACINLLDQLGDLTKDLHTLLDSNQPHEELLRMREQFFKEAP